jgi:hypothetical protein
LKWWLRLLYSICKSWIKDKFLESELTISSW